MNPKFVRLALVAGVLLLMPVFASGQGAPSARPAAKPVAPAQEPAYKPAVLQADPKGLTLLDAVRLALQNDPNVRLRDVDVERQGGVLREQRGFFDMLFKGKASFDYSQSELRDSDKRSEQIKREQIAAGIAVGDKLLPSVNAAVDNLVAGRASANWAAFDYTKNVADQDVLLEMGLIQGQLRLINDLYNATTNAAVKSDLLALRDKTFTAGVSRFDEARTELNADLAQAKRVLAQLGSVPIDQWDTTGNVRLDFNKPLRSGIVLNPFFNFDYSNSNYVGKSSWDPEFGGLGVKPFFKAQAGIDVVVPLARGRGRADADANEMAAQHDLEVSRLTALHQKSRTVLDTALAYWNLRAAAEQVDVARRSVEMQRQFADLVLRLVAAKEKARTDQTRVQASLADAQARFENAERQLVEARVNLARVMGVAVADAQAIPMAADAFPLPPAFTIDAAATPDLTRQAMQTRVDLKAAAESQESGKVLARGAKLETRRLFNLTLSGWGTTTSEDTPRWDRWVFRSGRAGLEFEIPFGNDTAEGRYQQAVASLHRADITASDAARTVALNVQRATESLRLAAERVKWAQDAATSYDQTVLDEQKRMQSGDSTLVDLILTEQQTTSARLSLVQALQDYASLLARLRFEAGLFMSSAGGQTTIAFDNLTTVPSSLQKR
jgi:outer membrane protein TolC